MPRKRLISGMHPGQPPTVTSSARSSWLVRLSHRFVPRILGDPRRHVKRGLTDTATGAVSYCRFASRCLGISMVSSTGSRSPRAAGCLSSARSTQRGQRPRRALADLRLRVSTSDVVERCARCRIELAQRAHQAESDQSALVPHGLAERDEGLSEGRDAGGIPGLGQALDSLERGGRRRCAGAMSNRDRTRPASSCPRGPAW